MYITNTSHTISNNATVISNGINETNNMDELRKYLEDNTDLKIIGNGYNGVVVQGSNEDKCIKIIPKKNDSTYYEVEDEASNHNKLHGYGCFECFGEKNQFYVIHMSFIDGKDIIYHNKNNLVDGKKIESNYILILIIDCLIDAIKKEVYPKDITYKNMKLHNNKIKLCDLGNPDYDKSKVEQIREMFNMLYCGYSYIFTESGKNHVTEVMFSKETDISTLSNLATSKLNKLKDEIAGKQLVGRKQEPYQEKKQDETKTLSINYFFMILLSMYEYIEPTFPNNILKQENLDYGINTLPRF